MSLLADLLSRIKQPQPKREIPPNLKNIVQSSSNKSSNKRKIVLLAIILAVFVFAGVGALLFVKKLEQSSGSSIALTSPPISPEPVARESVKTGQPEIKASQAVQPEKASRPELSVKKSFSKPLRPAQKPDDTGRAVVQDVASENERSVEKQPESSHEISKETAKLPVREEEKRSKQRDLYLYLAREHELKSAHREALADYKKALETDSNNISIMNSIAFMYLQLGLHDASISHSQKALDIDNEYVPALTNMGIALAKLEEFTESENYFRSALTLEPENRNVLLNLAILLEKQGRNKSSADYYKRLTGLGDIEGMFGLARIYERQGEIEKATQVYRNASSHESLDEKTRNRIRQNIMRLINY